MSDEQHIGQTMKINLRTGEHTLKPDAESSFAAPTLLGAQTYQPEMWTVAKDVIYAAIPAVEAGLEYTQELLAQHEVSLGRTTRKNKLTAEAMERDIEQMRRALDALRKCP